MSSKNNIVNLVGTAGILLALRTFIQNNKNNSTKSTKLNQIRWANWPLYLDEDDDDKTYPTLEKFQKENNIKVTYTESIDDNNTFFEKIQAQLKLNKDCGYDIITPTGWMLDRYIRLGYLKKLDSNKWTNKKNLLFKDDNRLDNAFTHQNLMSGFGWNVKKNP